MPFREVEGPVVYFWSFEIKVQVQAQVMGFWWRFHFPECCISIHFNLQRFQKVLKARFQASQIFGLKVMIFWGSRAGETCFSASIKVVGFGQHVRHFVSLSKSVGCLGTKSNSNLCVRCWVGFVTRASQIDMTCSLPYKSTLLCGSPTNWPWLLCSFAVFGESFPGVCSLFFAARALGQRICLDVLLPSLTSLTIRRRFCAVFFAVASRTMSVPSMWVVWNSNRF